ncbi:MAG: hypothetical protein WBE37_19070 [Bryobacteraceae bacterium]
MNELLLGSARLYQKLLLLYPAELRRDFGAEMVLAFADDMEAAWGDARIAGVLQIWWYALREIVTVALPAQTSNPCVLVPALSFGLAALTQGTELALSLRNVTFLDYSVLFDEIRFVVLLPSVANACVAFVVTRFYASTSITSLRLE